MLDLQDQLNLGYLETDVLAKGDISWNRQVIGLEHIRDGLEARKKFRNLKFILIIVV